MLRRFLSCFCSSRAEPDSREQEPSSQHHGQDIPDKEQSVSTPLCAGSHAEETSRAVEPVPREGSSTLEVQDRSERSHASADTKEVSEVQSQVVEKEFNGFNHSEKKMPEDLEKEQTQPLLAAKTTSQKTQRKKWSLFSRKTSGKQESEEEEAPKASSAQTAIATDTECFQAPEHVALSHAKDQHSPVRISNGLSVTKDAEESRCLTTGQDNKDTSCTVNSSHEKVETSEPSSIQDGHQNSAKQDCSLEISSVELRGRKQTDEQNKREEAAEGHDLTEGLVVLKLVPSESRQSELPAKEAAENVITLKKRMFVDSAFYADPEGKYPTAEEQINLARQVAHSILLPINQNSRGHQMFMKMGHKARIYTSGATAEDIATALAELNLSPNETEKFYQESPWAKGKSENKSLEEKSLEVEPPRLPVPSSVLFAPNLTAKMTAEQLNALSSEELERVMVLQEMSDCAKPSKPSSQVYFRFSEDIRNMKGKGARLFADRQAKADSWMVEDSSRSEMDSTQPAANFNSNRISLPLREGGKVDSASVSQQKPINEPSSPTRSKVPPKTLPKTLGLHAKGEQHEDKKFLPSPSSGAEEDKSQLGCDEKLSSESAGDGEITSVSSSLGPACKETSLPSASAEEPLSESTSVSAQCLKDLTSDISSVSQASSSGPTSDKESVCRSSVTEPSHDSTMVSTTSATEPAVEGKLGSPSTAAEDPVCDIMPVSQSATGTSTEAQATDLHTQSGPSVQESCQSANEDISLATKVPPYSPSTIPADT